MRLNLWVVLIIVLLAAGLAVAAAAGTAELSRPGLQATPQLPQMPHWRDGGRWGGPMMPGPGRMGPDSRQRAPLETPAPF